MKYLIFLFILIFSIRRDEKQWQTVFYAKKMIAYAKYVL